MEVFATIISIVSGCVTVFGFVAIFVKYGKDKGTMETTLQNIGKQLEKTPNKEVLDTVLAELRRDVDANAGDIKNMGVKINKLEVDNKEIITGLSSDVKWIKSTLENINAKMDKREG